MVTGHCQGNSSRFRIQAITSLQKHWPPFRSPHHSILVGNFGSNHGWKFVETAASHSEISKEFLNGYASFHTICGTALSVVFDLQVDVPRTSFFSLPWLLADERTQQPTRQNPYRTHWHGEESGRMQRFFRRPYAQPRNTRPLRLFHLCPKKPLVRARPKGR
jgi:hypothetical protein